MTNIINRFFPKPNSDQQTERIRLEKQCKALNLKEQDSKIEGLREQIRKINEEIRAIQQKTLECEWTADERSLMKLHDVNASVSVIAKTLNQTEPACHELFASAQYKLQEKINLGKQITQLMRHRKSLDDELLEQLDKKTITEENGWV